jgi:hypothetical protein
VDGEDGRICTAAQGAREDGAHAPGHDDARAITLHQAGDSRGEAGETRDVARGRPRAAPEADRPPAQHPHGQPAGAGRGGEPALGAGDDRGAPEARRAVEQDALRSAEDPGVGHEEHGRSRHGAG